jgi:hypothetical protein
MTYKNLRVALETLKYSLDAACVSLDAHDLRTIEGQLTELAEQAAEAAIEQEFTDG